MTQTMASSQQTLLFIDCSLSLPINQNAFLFGCNKCKVEKAWSMTGKKLNQHREFMLFQVHASKKEFIWCVSRSKCKCWCRWFLWIKTQDCDQNIKMIIERKKKPSKKLDSKITKELFIWSCFFFPKNIFIEQVFDFCANFWLFFFHFVSWYWWFVTFPANSNTVRVKCVAIKNFNELLTRIS